MAHHLLIVDDEKDLCSGLSRLLAKSFPSAKITAVHSGEAALAFTQANDVGIALIDIQMDGMSGLELLQELSSRDPWLTAVMMTGYGTIATAVEAIKLGAYDFITKPFDRDLLLRTISKALERNRLLRENYTLKQQFCDKAVATEFVGESSAMKRFLGQLETVARTSYTTLVRGASGTGKELAAKAIHSLSDRADKPLVMVNCPAIPEHLLESELFGHTKGAFTGASHEQRGLFVEADGGTLCLDEVGDIPIAIQAKLLRVLQEGEVKPLGATRTQTVDVRVLALTNLDLETMIAERTFREDLFYRLNVVTLNTPLLEEISDDIPLLVAHFTRKVCCELDLPVKRFDQQALSSLCHRKWPGNVRELQNVVRRSVMFCNTDIITVADIQFDGPRVTGDSVDLVPGDTEGPHDETIVPYKEAKEQAVDRFTTGYVKKLLASTGGNVSQAAELSGLSRVALQKIIRRHDIDAAAYRQQSRQPGDIP